MHDTQASQSEVPRPRTRWLRAVTFTLSLAWRHLRSDPARLPLLALRLAPGPLRRALRALAARAGGRARAYALWDQGRRGDARAAVLASASGAPPRRVSRLVAACLAAGDAETARELVEQLPEGELRETAEYRTALATGRAVAPPSSVSPDRHGITLTRGARTRPDDTVNARRPEERAGERWRVAEDPSSPGAGLRVLHLVTNALPHTNAGYTQRTHRIAVAQREAGMDVHVVTRVGYPLTKGVPDPRTLVRLDGVSYHRLLPWTAPADAAGELEAGVRMAAPLVEALRPHVLHAASNHHNARLALELGRRFGLPVVYEVRGFLEESWLSRDPSRSVDDAFYRTERANETECMLSADLVVTLGEAMRADIEARGVARERLLVVPNAVEASFLEPLPLEEGARVREELGIGAEEFVVGTTTSCFGYEGLDTLLEAVALMREGGERAHALIVGDGPELPALRARAESLGLRGVAHFTGRVPADRVRAHHAALNVFAVPRRDERVCRLVTPLKPVEAMAGGLPVVTSDLPALREIVEPGVTGELIPAGESASLADVLTKLAYSREKRASYGSAGRGLVADRTWTEAAYRYNQAYRVLIRKMTEPGQNP